MTAIGSPESFYARKDGRLLLRVKVTPKADRDRIVGVKGRELLIRINAVPEKGKANKELLRFLSKSLDLSKSALALVSGLSSRHKVVSLPEEAAPGIEKLYSQIRKDVSP